MTRRYLLLFGVAVLLVGLSEDLSAQSGTVGSATKSTIGGSCQYSFVGSVTGVMNNYRITFDIRNSSSTVIASDTKIFNNGTTNPTWAHSFTGSCGGVTARVRMFDDPSTPLPGPGTPFFDMIVQLTQYDIPTLAEWGLLLMAAGLLTLGSITLLRRGGFSPFG